MRHLAALILAALLALTSQTVAVARGLAGVPGITVVLCGDDHRTAIRIDQRGKPLGPAHRCPDCPAPVARCPPPAAPAPPAPPAAGRAALLPAEVQAPRPLPLVPPARGPPALV